MKKILIVDDEQMILEMQKRYLEDFDYQCFIAECYDSALRVIDEQEVDLALLDINMPGLSGVELLKQIKNRLPDIALVMATAVDDYNVAEQCLMLGADDYIIKPFSQGRVLVSVRNALEKQRLKIVTRNHQDELKRKLQKQSEELKASQTMLIQQEKLAAIGQLAAGVAHEINNPVGYISGNLAAAKKYLCKLEDYFKSLKTAQEKLPEELALQIKTDKKRHKIDLIMEDLADLFDESLDGAGRIKDIVQGLQCFSRTDSDNPVPVNINDCIENAITIIWNEIKYNIVLEREFGDLPKVNGFQQQLSQVFMNLLVNASHAIQRDGIIRIKTYKNGGKVIISVIDNGCGIPEENLEKIFDPFFTTKELGKGTGLGMSISNGIINNHGGTIAVKSKLDQGTEFTITLPVASS